ncbi:hypothetical protein [Massilia pseudoviolaceinigra]|uniref:hypothetical protein n=1 Tax=Massilia pseudoviolaceinigra TaxID=3057165 RepID=UPI0027966AD1|nr:hypothetical protein [Massilia sp. CCM 9206]MDQ1924782.1 hypothetical protein [Massilia sp. CCM 9206]
MSLTEPLRTPHYWYDDAVYVLLQAEPVFYLSLSDRAIRNALERMKIRARDYQKFVSAYPSVCCEPLEQFYLFRKGMNMLNEELLCDLLFSFGWREANWGAWLAALAPQPVYAAHLARRLPTLPHGTTVVGLALAACGQEVQQELSDTYALLVEVRETLDRLPVQPIPVRRNYSRDQECAIRRENDAVRDAYRTGGLDAAKKLLDQGLLRHFKATHQEWLRAGAPDAPAVARMRQLRHKVLPRF